MNLNCIKEPFFFVWMLGTLELNKLGNALLASCDICMYLSMIAAGICWTASRFKMTRM